MKYPRLHAGLAAALVATVLAPAAQASKIVPVPVPERVRGAERVVVATVGEMTSHWDRNDAGDQVIATHVTLHVQEALKGRPAATIPFEIEGGTVDGVTLEVSSLPALTPGERGVFFLARDGRGRYVPHLKGQGILKLDPQDRVEGTSLTLAEIRGMAAAAR